jgi:hypothetical protein
MSSNGLNNAKQQLNASGQYAQNQVQNQVQQTSQKGPPPPDNRYDDKRKELASNASFGTALWEVENSATDGEVDFQHSIKTAIKQQYYTFGQYWQGNVISFFFGACLSLWILQAVTGFAPGTDTLGFWGVFLISGFVGALISRRNTRRIKVCRKVDPFVTNKVGRPCFSSWDCTTFKKFNKPLCLPKKMGVFTATMRTLTILFTLFGGVSFLAIGFSKGDVVKNMNLYYAIAVGGWVGMAAMYVFS